jgi:Lon protease-like protein
VQLPLFPLHTVLFPGGVLPLHVFEERYRVLVAEKLDFGIVLIRSGRDVGDAPELYEMGTVATYHRVEALEDGRFNVLARGLSRFRILGLDRSSRPYLVAEVEVVEEPPGRGTARLLGLLEQYLRLVGVEVAPQLSPESGKRAVWLVGTVLQAEPAKLQRLLETGDPALAEAMLASEVGRLKQHGHLSPLSPDLPSPN